jgi:N4-(beta-N-acetylglucosaminyl)-L-asparaginase
LCGPRQRPPRTNTLPFNKGGVLGGFGNPSYTVLPMIRPILLSTWKFGQTANRAGWPVLTHDSGSSIDAVEAACRAVEADPGVRSVGYGGRPDATGEVTLDGAIMLSPARCGAVAFVRGFMHPVSIARRVMERTCHVLLVGDGAERFAREQGFEPSELLTEQSRQEWRDWLADRNAADDAHDTVGVLALDAAGRLAGACSTSGLPYKLPGRVGDSPIIGHALYVDPGHGAAVATGKGELVMGVCGAMLAVEQLRRGAAPRDTVAKVLGRIAGAYDLAPEDQVGLIVLSPTGQWSTGALRPDFPTAVRTPDRDELVEPDVSILGDGSKA